MGELNVANPNSYYPTWTWNTTVEQEQKYFRVKVFNLRNPPPQKKKKLSRKYEKDELIRNSNKHFLKLCFKICERERRHLLVRIEETKYNQSWASDNSVATMGPSFQGTKLFVIVILLFFRAGRAFLDSRSRVPGVLGTWARNFF